MRLSEKLAGAGALALLASPLPAIAQSAAQGEIVVRGKLEKPSKWREAETGHVVVTSDGSETELVRIAHNLERLHFLLAVLTGRVDRADDTRKLRVTLVGDPTEFDAMALVNLRYTPGPYRWGFEAQGYYDPRDDGPVLAATRFDAKVQVERGPSAAAILPDLVRATGDTSDPVMAGVTAAAAASLGSRASFGGNSDPGAIDINQSSIPVPAEGRIYAAFARNWLLTYYPGAYPRWYVDGFGELFATLDVKRDGAIEYGRAPEGYAKVLDAVRAYPVKEVFAGKYLTARGADRRWTPFHAWALTHMLFFSETRRPQLRRYLAAVAAGEPVEKAVEAFGDLGQLQQELARYDDHKLPYEKMTYPAARVDEPYVRRLNEGEAAFVKGRLELASRTTIPAPAPPGTDPKGAADAEQAYARAIARRDRWLGGLRRDAGRYPRNLQAQLLLAEAECRSGNPAECFAAAERALAARPGHADALAWKGIAMLDQALADRSPSRAARLKAARVQIARANRADPSAPLPLIAYYRSFADAGEPVPGLAIDGLRQAVDAVPAAPGPRLLLGEALARRGDAAAARTVLLPVALGAYDAPERSRALALMGGS